MAERGCVWMAEARGSLMQHVGPSGIGQLDLVQKTGLTKQAVQQHLDGLVEDGVVERVVDDKDARKKHIRLTLKGQQARETANAVKLELDAELSNKIGSKRFGELMSTLALVAGPTD